MPPDVRIVVCDSKVSRELAGSAYNERRAQCEEAVRLLQGVLPGSRHCVMSHLSSLKSTRTCCRIWSIVAPGT